MVIRCPTCRSSNYQRFRRPSDRVDGSVFRRHLCLECGKVFTTEQRVVDPERVDDLLEMISSVPTPDGEVSVPLATTGTRAS